jgi:hypothetical protein
MYNELILFYKIGANFISIMDILQIGLILISIVIIGEAFALLVGMHFLSGRSNSWISFKNDFLLAVDIITGAGLIYFATTHVIISPLKFMDITFILILAISTHGYREWEYLADVINKFCANIPLFIFNNVKLITLIVISIAAVISKFNLL